MTVAAGVVKNKYQGNASTSAWPYTFPIAVSTDIHVYLTSAAGVVTEIFTNFTVVTATSSVTYPNDLAVTPALPVGQYITLIRETPLAQETNLVNGGPLNSEVLEDEYDSLELQIQEVNEAVDRCVKYGVDQTVTDTSVATILAASASASSSSTAAASSAAAALASEVSAAASAVAAGVAENNAETAATAAASGRIPLGTYAALKAMAVPGTAMVGYAIDPIDQFVAYCGDATKGDAGWRILG